MASLESLISSFQDRFKKLSPGQKKQIAIFCVVSFSVILVLAVLLSFDSSEKNESQQVPQRQNIRLPIPAGEVFLPDEPDFLPGVLLGREQRSVWTEQDAAEYWQNPLRQGEEEWRNKIETSIDELLERVP